jgi:ATP-dependent DNA helicase RecG
MKTPGFVTRSKAGRGVARGLCLHFIGDPTGKGAGKVGDGGTESGPGWDQVGTKSGLSRHQVEILRKCLADAEIAVLMTIAERVNRTKFRDQVLKPLLAANLLAMTIPDKPTSRNQRYRTTDKGRTLLVTLPTEKTE